LTTSERVAERTAFIEKAGWGDAELAIIADDASTRSYTRLIRGEHTAILMDAPTGAEASACPPSASPEDRHTLGYNAEARLAGPNLVAFAGLSNALCERGFSAPKVLAHDLDGGFLLLEDLGDALFSRIVPAEMHEGTVYSRAVDTLAALYRSSFAETVAFEGQDWPLQAYDDVALHAETDLFLDWFLTQYAEIELSDAAREDWRAIWAHSFARLAACPPGLVLRDYHAENLIHLPERDGHGCVGVLDFQDAVLGHPAYDLVSLLEDARRNVDRKLAVPLKARFVAQAGIQDPAAFDAAYAVLGAQRNAKILGIFVRLALRDGKKRYLNLLPRVARHFVADLQHPALMQLLMWAKTHAQPVFREAHR
jgi:aminoglycoside/choline kinase family phosphotransferase